MENNETTITKSENQEPYLGVWYDCNNCKGSSIIAGDSYCPDCGYKLIK